MTTTRCPTCAKPLGDTLTERILALLVQKMTVTHQPTTFSYLRDTTGKSDQAVANALRTLRQRGAIEKRPVGGMHGWMLTEQQIEQEDIPTEQRNQIYEQAHRQAEEKAAEVDLAEMFAQAMDTIRGRWDRGEKVYDNEIRAFLVKATGIHESTIEALFDQHFLTMYQRQVRFVNLTGELVPA